MIDLTCGFCQICTSDAHLRARKHASQEKGNHNLREQPVAARQSVTSMTEVARTGQARSGERGEERI
jgi:hypothetical protein